jgi:hypothetical protein
VGCHPEKRWRDRFGFFESFGPQEPAVSNLGFILICLFLLLLLGGLGGGSVLPYWDYVTDSTSAASAASASS